jgi:hypothetical protein
MFFGAAYLLYGVYPDRFPPTDIHTKMSNIHSPAGFPAAILLCVFLDKIHVACRSGSDILYALPRTVVVVFLGLMVGFFVMLQQVYVGNFERQLIFWQSIPMIESRDGAERLVVVDEVRPHEGESLSPPLVDWSAPHLTHLLVKAKDPALTGPLPLVIPRWALDAYATRSSNEVVLDRYPTIARRSFSSKNVLIARVYGDAQRWTWLDGTPVTSSEAHCSPRLSEVTRRGELMVRAYGRVVQVFYPNNYTGGGWTKGIRQIPGDSNDQFYFITDKLKDGDIEIGDEVEFLSAGRALVRKIDRLQLGEREAIFVQVSKDLSPDEDGFPGRVVVYQ